MLALEIIFLSILAILHLANSDSELRALARAGQGGGLIGWGLSYPIFWILGRQAALVFFGGLIGICAIVTVGLRRRHIASVLTKVGGKLQLYSELSTKAPQSIAEDDESRAIYHRLAGSSAFRAQVMRIRPNPASATGAGSTQTAGLCLRKKMAWRECAPGVPASRNQKGIA